MSSGPVKKGSPSSYRPRRAPGMAFAGRRSYAVLAAFGVAASATGIMRSQEPRANPLQPPTLAEWFFKPHQRNAFLQMPAIGANLNAVFALPGTDLVWVAGDGGLLLRSEDGGRTWERGRVTADSVVADTSPVPAPASVNVTTDTSIYPTADSAGPDQAMAPRTRAGALQAALSLLAPAPLYAQEQKQDTSRQQEQERGRITVPNLAGLTMVDASRILAGLRLFVAQVDSVTSPSPVGTILRQAPAPGTELVRDRQVRLWVSAGPSRVPGPALGAGSDSGQVSADTVRPDTAAVSGRGPGEYTAAILSLWFVDDSVGYAGSNDGEVLKTTDGGRTWTASPEAAFPIVAIHFETVQRGWFHTTYPATFGTGDGGQTWIPDFAFRREVPRGLLEVPLDLALREGPALDEVVLGDSSLIRTVGQPVAAFFLANGRGWFAVSVSGTDSSVLYTRATDVPATRIPGARLPGLDGLFFGDDQRGWAWTHDGRVLRTSDGGRRWTQGRTPGGGRLRQVRFTDRSQGWAVGENGTILRTVDGGRRWRLVAGGGDQLRSVSFADARRGWAVGTGGTILRTTDGGRTWKPQRSGTDKALYAVRAISRDTVVAAGSDATILRTTDGRKWEAVHPDSALIPSPKPALSSI